MSFQFAHMSEHRVWPLEQQYLPPLSHLSAPVIHLRNAHESYGLSSASSSFAPEGGSRSVSSSAILILLDQLNVVLSVPEPSTLQPTCSALAPDQVDAAGYSESTQGRHSNDAIVDHLSQALRAAESSQDVFGGIYADAVRLAIVARLLALRTDAKRDAPELALRSRTALPKWRLKRVVDYIDARMEEAISLADMAAVTGLSRMHFAAQFRAATGIRPHEFLLRRRIERAKQMLAATETSIVEIALTVGFQTQAHFTTVFKRFVGETPNRWRSANRDPDNASDPTAWQERAVGSHGASQRFP
jgi:AraC-like DNA-binding protein